MRKLYLLALAILAGVFPFQLSAQQSTARIVYDIFQANCTSCHSNASPAGNLDLEGVGATLQAKIDTIRAMMYGATPTNSFAAGKGYKLIHPGDPYRSYLFRRVHNGLDGSVVQDSLEGSPKTGLDDTEIEMIRQWILYDAPVNGAPVDSALVADFYNGNGILSIDTIPDAPAPGTGFQVHLGPFFLEPNKEEEFFWKYKTETPAGSEVTAISPLFGPWSHHFILNQFNSGQDGGYSYGLRDASSHFDAPLMGVFQFADTLDLPGGTAFDWPADVVLDFNSHFINYSFTDVLACDVYLNVYTQPVGTANQIMNAEMVPNFTIYIPNDTSDYTFEFPYFNPLDNSTRYMWSVTSHTHKYGKEFKVFTRNSNGSKDDLIYDADYFEGQPNGLLLGYDYQHPPQRFFHDFLPIKVNEGLIFRATYNNNGPQAVGWGDQSDDEMMLLIYYYLEDTAGVVVGREDVEEGLNAGTEVNVWPNPARGQAVMQINNAPAGGATLQVLDGQGRRLRTLALTTAQLTGPVRMDLSGLPSGLYFYRIQSEKSDWSHTGKLIIE